MRLSAVVLGLSLAGMPALADGLFIGQAGPALIAIAVNDGAVRAYLCDGDAGDLTLWGRFDGALGAEGAVLVAGNGHVLRWQGADPRAGEILLRDGGTVAFSAAPAADGAGWWQAQGLAGEAGLRADWIVAADGRIAGTLQRRNVTTAITDGTSNTITDGTSNTVRDGTSNTLRASFHQAVEAGRVTLDGADLAVVAVQ